MDAHIIIKRPLITEKSVHQQNATNTYTFSVDKRANKTQIREAIESMFKVKVSSVRTCTIPGKRVRRGKHVGSTSPWKKAFITVADGQKLEGV
jgi:large subunit ribosomal protein L23